MLKLKDKIVPFIKTLVLLIGTTILGMVGGQKEKGARRYGIPGLALIAGLVTEGVQWRDFIFLMLLPVLSMGYGEKSWLVSLVHYDWLVRLVYAGLLSLPFWFFSWKRGLISLGLLVGVFQIHAGGYHIAVWNFDILYEDIARYSALSGLIAYNIFFPKKS